VFVKVYSYKNVSRINYFRNFHTVFCACAFCPFIVLQTYEIGPKN